MSAVWRIGIPFELGLGAAACGLAWLFHGRAAETLRLDWGGFVWGVLGAAPMLAGLYAFIRWPIPPFQRIRALMDGFLRDFADGASLGSLGWLSLAAGVGEELLFRGFLQGSIALWFGSIGALAVASVLFGALHAITFAYAVLAALIGVYLGVLWLATGNLLAPIVAHALYDWVALAWFLHFSPDSSTVGPTPVSGEPESESARR